MNAQDGDGGVHPRPEQSASMRNELSTTGYPSEGRVGRLPVNKHPLQRGGRKPVLRPEAGREVPRPLGYPICKLNRAGPSSGYNRTEEGDLERIRRKEQRDASLPLYGGRTGELFPWFNILKGVFDLLKIRPQDLDRMIPRALTGRALEHVRERRGTLPWTMDRLIHSLAEEFEPSNLVQPICDFYALRRRNRESAVAFLERLERQYDLAYPPWDANEPSLLRITSPRAGG